jgi:predicted Zn-dependent protease
VERLNMRVLSPFLSVTDDPFARYYEGKPLIGSYDVDDEGVPAQKLKLVGKGKLLDYYMSRAATRDFNKSNGHGRAEFSEYSSGAPSNVFIRAEENSSRVLTPADLKAKLIGMCREQELEYCLLVKSLDNLSEPFGAYRVYVNDGREEPVHGVEFTGTSLRALRDIAAVSKDLYVYYPDWSTPGSIVAPSILVQEMEVKKTESKPEKKPYLQNPYFAK